MRARKKKNTPERLIKYADLFIHEKSEMPSVKGKLCLEIGCGKGGFITEMAMNDTETQYVGVEKISDVAVMAAIKIDENKINNAKLMITDADKLCDYFDEKTVDVIYLNFSDPWPPKKRAKRRLTHRNFLAVYSKLLKSDGRIEFKTDNDKLFDFSLEEFPEAGYQIDWQTRDLHSENVPNVMTEYEKRFSDEGIKIKKLTAHFVGKRDAEENKTEK